MENWDGRVGRLSLLEFGTFRALGSRMDVVMVEGLSMRINKGVIYVYTLGWYKVESTTCRGGG